MTQPLSHLSNEGKSGGKGYGIEILFRILLLQFMEELSDRQMERFLRENLAGKWLCGFSLTDKTPDFSLLSKARKRIGTTLLSECFARARKQLKAKGYLKGIFTFVDASALIAKSQLWKERDKAKQKKYDKLNNETLPKVATKKQHALEPKSKTNSGMATKNTKASTPKAGSSTK